MTIYDKGCISNYRNCSLCCFSNVLYRMLTLNATPQLQKYRELWGFPSEVIKP